MARQPDAHIPTVLKDSIVEMIAVDADAVAGDWPTIFVGVVGGEYTQEKWDRHKARMASLLRIECPELCDDIRVVGLGPDSNIVDIEKLQQLVTAAVNAINQANITQIRFVGLGVGSSVAITDAIESLLRSWNIDYGKKVVQFVAVGESDDYHYLNFCKGLCMKKLCGRLQYYNTMDYNPFGYMNINRGMKESNVPQRAADVLTRLTGQLVAAVSDQH